MICDPATLCKAVALVDTEAWIVPFNYVINLSKKNTFKLLKSQPKWPLDLEPVNNKNQVVKSKKKFVGKENVIKRENYFAAGGFDESFAGLGGEDNAFRYAVNTLCGPFQRLDREVIHFWHPNAAYNKRLRKKYAEASLNKRKMLKLINREKL